MISDCTSIRELPPVRNTSKRKLAINQKWKLGRDGGLAGCDTGSKRNSVYEVYCASSDSTLSRFLDIFENVTARKRTDANFISSEK